MSKLMHTIAQGLGNISKKMGFLVLVVGVLASQVFAAYRIPVGVTLLPLGTAKADTQVFQTCIVKDTQWAYFIYLPPTYDPNGTKEWPCYINVPAFNYNGSGKLADIFTTHFMNGGMAEWLQGDQPANVRQISNRFIVITPFVDWNVCSSISGHPERIKNLFDTLTKVYKIDKGRMNMGGYCFGAGVTYTFATFYPKYLNHMMLFAGNDNWASTFNLAKACSLKTIPIRQFADSTCSCGDMATARAAQKAILACGGNNDSLFYTKSGWHEVWNVGGYDTSTAVYDWLLSGPPTAVEPGIDNQKPAPLRAEYLTGPRQIEVIGLNGQRVLTRKGSSADIENLLSKLGRGTYILRTTQGNRLITSTIINK